jgi:hypothetical protein
MSCQTVIQSQFGLSLSFTSFSTEAFYDVLTVYDGASSASPKLAELSGSGIAGRVILASGSTW